MELNHWYSCNKLGEGSYGSVYSLETLNVVVKLVPLTELSLLELDTMSRLRHQNIMQVLDFGIFKFNAPDKLISKVDLTTQNMFSYNFGFVMEKADKSLNHYKPKNKQETLNIIEQIKDGLVYLHENKIIHADMKPANVLLFENDNKINIKITDFGLSKYTQSLTTKDTLANTIGYRPPELDKNTPYIDNSIDYWALGNIIFNMVTGSDTYIQDYKGPRKFKDYFGNKSQVQIDDIIYNNFMRLGYSELIDFTQKCLTIDNRKIRIPTKDFNRINIAHNIGIHNDIKIQDDIIQLMIGNLKYQPSYIGYDVLLKMLQFYITNYDSNNDIDVNLDLGQIMLELYTRIDDMNSGFIIPQYIKLFKKLEYCKGIINNYSLYETPYRDIIKIKSLEDYENVFKYFFEF